MLVERGHALVDPALGQLPHFDGLVFTACDKLLQLLVPAHLRDGPIVSIEHEKRSAFLAVPEGDLALFVTRDDLTAMVSPQYYTLLGLTLCVADALRELLFARVVNIENGDVAVDVGCE